MKQVWIDLGQVLQAHNLKSLGITRVYFDSREMPRQASEFTRGIYRAQAWDNLGAAAFAKALSQDVNRWGGDPYKQLAVHANIEVHSAQYLIDFLRVWRSHRPVRETAIVLEGYQGGWFTTELCWRINKDANLTVLAEAYDGAMNPFGPDDVRSNLIAYGVDRGKAAVMYDAARLTNYWDGCAFTQQRLP